MISYRFLRKTSIFLSSLVPTRISIMFISFLQRKWNSKKKKNDFYMPSLNTHQFACLSFSLETTVTRIFQHFQIYLFIYSFLRFQIFFLLWLSHFSSSLQLNLYCFNIDFHKYCSPSIAYWVLLTEYCLLSIVYWVLPTEYYSLSIAYWVLFAEYCSLSISHRVLLTEDCFLNIARWVLLAEYCSNSHSPTKLSYWFWTKKTDVHYISCPVGWGSRIRWLHLCSVV